MQNKQYAQQLYMAGGKSQKEIAELTGVSERTIYTWVHQFAWDKLRLAAYQAPATIADNICSQLVEIQNAIAQREPGRRFPTMEEAEITRKLIVSLEKMKKYPSISQHMQVLETFRNYIRPADKEFAKQLATYTTGFLSAKTINGFAPYELEYGVNPIDPYYEEPEENGTPADIPCAHMDACLHPDDCSYPKCRYTKTSQPADALLTYNVAAFHLHHQQQIIDKQCYSNIATEETRSNPAISLTVMLAQKSPQTSSCELTAFQQISCYQPSGKIAPIILPPEISGSNPATFPTAT